MMKPFRRPLPGMQASCRGRRCSSLKKARICRISNETPSYVSAVRQSLHSAEGPIFVSPDTLTPKVEARTNGHFCTEHRLSIFTWSGALRKDIALLKTLAIHLRNADRLRPRLHKRTGHRGPSGSAESGEMRADLSRKGVRRTVGSARAVSAFGSAPQGRCLVVWKLDRLSRSVRDVLTLMEQLAEAKGGFGA